MPSNLRRIAACCALIVSGVSANAQQIVVNKDNRTIAVTTSADATADADTVTVEMCIRDSVHGVEALGLGLGKKHFLDGDDFKARLVHFRKNIGREAFADRVGLDDAKRSLHRKRSWLPDRP